MTTDAERRDAFIENLMSTGNVTESAKVAGFSRATVYRHRAAEPEFAARWDTAIDTLAGRISDALIAEAIDGEPIVNGEGIVVGRRRNTRLLERLAIKHGLLEHEKPSTAIAIQNNQNTAARDPKLVAAAKVNSDKLRALLLSKPMPVIVDAQVIDVTPVPASDPDEDLLE
jgi:phage terminase small subunit